MIESHETNRRYWDASASGWQKLRDRDGLWRECAEDPDVAVEGEALDGRDVCVIGSGDNYAAFTLAGMGAQVTSTDISEGQLAVAASRAASLGLDIDFVRSDAANLESMSDRSFDLVRSTNGFLTWIAEPGLVFGEVFRILRQNGVYVFDDVHPFQRPWRDTQQATELAKPYWDTGPHESDGDCPTVEFEWTIADLLNALARSGLRLESIAESPAEDSRFGEGYSYETGSRPELMGWRVNPRAGLPVWLTVAARKP
ncbi:MAG: class I SAM-dependent methyltransferase [SAR202 cluster bacterium]|nr:class I SAM-dependent methyltransferase [SAR202 cluster bacterium]